MNCKNCDKETPNPKFCSLSCSSSYSNRQNPKRQKSEKFCKRCKKSLGNIDYFSARILCSNCKSEQISWDTLTLAEARKQGNSNGNAAYIRTLSRKKFIASGRQLKCSICQYDYHVDICHIKGISSFADESLISEINSMDNLIALCKNHHYEFDTGFLKL